MIAVPECVRRMVVAGRMVIEANGRASDEVTANLEEVLWILSQLIAGEDSRSPMFEHYGKVEDAVVEAFNLWHGEVPEAR